jgi:thioester reductase-like protein
VKERYAILLTGATGLLGQYLVRDLLVRGHTVGVLARNTHHCSAAERVAEIVSSWSERIGQKLPMPRVLAGDLGKEHLGLSQADQLWLERNARTVIHAAASLSFKDTADGEPWRTNVDGTESLLAICRELGITDWHQVSTAFVCGRHSGLVREDDDDDERDFHNPYEASKFRAEQLVRLDPRIRATVYRPSIIVGDSRTGYTTTFTGLYRFMELAVRLASRNGAGRALPIRLPLTGEELWNLVPVDWVSRAIVELAFRPSAPGRTFHLVSRSPLSTRFIRDVCAAELGLDGIEFAAPGAGLSSLEEKFLAGIQEYCPYFQSQPIFDATNTGLALPELPAPHIDAPMLRKMVAFASSRNWGRQPNAVHQPHTQESDDGFVPRDYIEHVFPEKARRSPIARQVGLDVTVGVELQGPGGGVWSCKWVAGELIWVKRGLYDPRDVTYLMHTATFRAVIQGLQTPQEAFFEERIEISGDLERGLKLAALFGHFLSDNSAHRLGRPEVMDASACHG